MKGWSAGDGKYNLSPAAPTWSFGLPVCDATQPEDDGSLVLLHNLQKGGDASLTEQHGSNQGNRGFCQPHHCGRSPSAKTKWWWEREWWWRGPRWWPRSSHMLPESRSFQLQSRTHDAFDANNSWEDHRHRTEVITKALDLYCNKCNYLHSATWLAAAYCFARQV